jgi:ADP-heptose:LPS heptosyltransferase
MSSIVLWGPGDERLADAVVEHARGAAVLAPRTSLADLLTLARAARLVVSGDTGPLHLATAIGTPVVGIYGPTDPARNGPLCDADVSVSRHEVCQCYHLRRCRAPAWCLGDVEMREVLEAVDRRLDHSALPVPSNL